VERTDAPGHRLTTLAGGAPISWVVIEGDQLEHALDHPQAVLAALSRADWSGTLTLLAVTDLLRTRAVALDRARESRGDRTFPWEPRIPFGSGEHRLPSWT
jgi:hypothetical protein